MSGPQSLIEENCSPSGPLYSIPLDLGSNTVAWVTEVQLTERQPVHGLADKKLFFNQCTVDFKLIIK